MTVVAAAVTLIAGLLSAVPAAATPYLVYDLDRDAVLAEQQSFDPWYPASITKLMTVYVTLSAIASGEVSGTSGVRMTEEATREPPSKMGFKPGTVLTVDTALRIIMVKSANDVAMALGQRIGGSRDGFVDRMNQAAASLGMTGTHYANANGLPDPNQFTTARDYAILARNLIVRFPGYRDLFRIPALSLGGNVIRNHNNLLGRYPGADGMKTGFICNGGFNIVATASRNGRHILAIVFGGATAKARDELAARLLENAFASSAGGPSIARLKPSGPVASAVANMRDVACPVRRLKDNKKQRVAPALDDGDVGDAEESLLLPRAKVLDPVVIALGGASDMPDPPPEATPPPAVAQAALPPLPPAKPPVKGTAKPRSPKKPIAAR